MDISSQSKQADELRKQGKYLEAIPLYQEQIKASSSSYPTRWLIYCLRKSGNLENAYKNGLEALKKFPEDQYLRSEMGWVIYDREIKPGRDAGDIGQVVNAATRALELDPNNTFLVDRVCLVVMKTGKNAKNPDWQMIRQLSPLKFARQQTENNICLKWKTGM
jgi:tetratricopeptide (TPR) repeat protein